MRTHRSRRSRITTTLASSVVAAGALLGGFVAVGTAGAEAGTPVAEAATAGIVAAESDTPINEITGFNRLENCTAYMDVDGNWDAPQSTRCLPVDPFTEPDLTLAQRLTLVNPESPIHGDLVQQLENKFGK